MSTPHEIEYVITWGEEVLQKEDKTDANKVTADKETADTAAKKSATEKKAAVHQSLEDAGLSLSETCKLKYARGFTIEKYGDYDYISIQNSGDYLIVPENKEVPRGLPKEVVILQRPLDRTYLVSTSAMDLICTCGALDRIRLSAAGEKDWYIKAARDAMESGRLIYAGKYRAPDYELLLESGCDLAIENTMIYHEPAVKAKLEELGIPVLVETSSYEEHPLGRLEWIKLYGVLFDAEAEAEQYFDKQLAIIEPLMEERPDSGKTVAFFYVTANGLINVRKSGDYITKMIELSGGNYVPGNTGESDNALSTMNMQMEDFYVEASQADIILYNSTIGGEISSIRELIGKNVLFADFKAVRESRVYCCERNLFQQMTGMADFMKDLQDVLNGVDGNYTYLNKLE
ncbi:MAG: ABC transporter substrate-binding protein [Lachnospiraceae bacterium]|nr:ABC transporter substrate-binding protein [Lachnospiraceae bacterium]